MNRRVAADDPETGRLMPIACPFCRSPRISTPSEKVDASTYWRCEACGEMWNLGRLKSSPRYGYEGR
jgi:ribosomal protein L37AE/L43A